MPSLPHTHGMGGLTVADVSTRAGVRNLDLPPLGHPRKPDDRRPARGSRRTTPCPRHRFTALRPDHLHHLAGCIPEHAQGNDFDRALAADGDDPAASRARKQYWDSHYSRSGEIITRAIDHGKLPDTTDPVTSSKCSSHRYISQSWSPANCSTPTYPRDSPTHSSRDSSHPHPAPTTNRRPNLRNHTPLHAAAAGASALAHELLEHGYRSTTEQYGDLVDVRVQAIQRRHSSREVFEHALSPGIAHATGPVRYPSDPTLKTLPRICVPLRARGELHGYLWLIDSPPLTESEIADIAELLHQHAQSRTTGLEQEAQSVGAVPAPHRAEPPIELVRPLA